MREEELHREIREMTDRFIGTSMTPKALLHMRAHLRSICRGFTLREGRNTDFLIFDVFPHKTDPNQAVVGVARNYAKYPMSAMEFEEFLGSPPENDDLERVNCKEAGTIGHSQCGWCLYHSRPRFECGCVTEVKS
jgi:hypothetical protein